MELFADGPLTWETALTIITTAIMAALLKWFDDRSAKRAAATQAKVDAVHVLADGLSTKLANAAFNEGKAIGKADGIRAIEEQRGHS